ncbi:MAG: hypothetical protein ACRDZ7_03095 [Acidimicrobiia bacterium]
MSDPEGPDGLQADEPAIDLTDEQEERRRRVMERLAEILQGPSPGSGGGGGGAGGGPPATGGLEAAMAEFGDSEEAAALFQTLLVAFQTWQQKTPPGAGEEPEA